MVDPHQPGSAVVRVTVRYFAAARAAAGVMEEEFAVRGPATAGDVLSAAIGRHGPDLERVVARCSFLLDETAVHGADAEVTDGSVMDVLPPFAGG